MQRLEIEARALHEPADVVVAAMGVSPHVLGRHLRRCVPRAMARNAAIKEMASSDWLAGQALDALAEASDTIREYRTDAAGKRSDLIAAQRLRLEVLTFIGRAIHSVAGDNVTINIANDIKNEQRIVNLILPVLDGHPELQRQIAAALSAA